MNDKTKCFMLGEDTETFGKGRKMTIPTLEELKQQLVESCECDTPKEWKKLLNYDASRTSVPSVGTRLFIYTTSSLSTRPATRTARPSGRSMRKTLRRGGAMSVRWTDARAETHLSETSLRRTGQSLSSNLPLRSF